MLNRIAVPFALACALALVPASAHALGLFVGGAVGQKVDGSSISDQLGAFNPRADNAAYKVFAGITLTRLLGVEVAYYDLGRRTCCEGLADAGSSSTLDGYSAAVLVGFPLPLPRLHLYGKAGILNWGEDGELISIAGSTSFSKNGTDLLLGVGVRLRILEHFGVRGEWERLEFGDSSENSLWLGAEARW
jgi:Outer membrane protein beta-barrel domain